MARASCCELFRVLLVVALASPVHWCRAQNVTRRVACTTGRNTGYTCDCRLATNRPQVSCQTRQLEAVPTAIPFNTTVLTLSSNLITQIYQNDFRGLEQVETLFLQLNRIEAIHPLAFRNMYKLKILILHDNRLTTIPAQLFQHLPSLADINLQRNRISHISRYAFVTMRNATISMNENPLACDCEALALKKWLTASQASVRLNTAICANGSRPLMQLTQSDVPGCASDGVYESTLFCHTCTNAISMRHCRENGTVLPCQGALNACTTEVTLASRHMVITKRCQAVTSCLMNEWNNARQCGVSQTGISYFNCHFCCLNSHCNRPINSSEARTREMNLRVSVQIAPPQGVGVINNSSGLIAASVIKTILTGTDYGGYDVKFEEARDNPPITLVFLVVATVVNTPLLRWRDVRDAINATLQVRLMASYLANMGVMPETLQFGSLPDLPDQGHVVDVCQQETQETGRGTFLWPPTLVGQTARLHCPHGTGEPGFRATRTCAQEQDGPAWQTAFVRMCRFARQTTQDLQDLLDTPIDRDSAPGVARQLANLTKASRDFGKDDVRLSVDVANKVLDEPSVLASRDVISTLVSSFSDLTAVPVSVLREAQQEDSSSKKLLEAISRVGKEASLSGGKLQTVQPRLALVAVPLSPSQSFPGLELAASTPPNSSLDAGKVEVRNGTSSGGSGNASTRTSITLPPSLLASGSPASRVAFNLFQNDNLFSAIQGDDDSTAVTPSTTPSDVISDTEQRSYVTRVNSHVIAASVPGQTLENLREPVLISLSHRDQGGANPRCVYWDEGEGRWSSRGCRMNSTGTTHTVCACDHLTNFALVMDVYQTGSSLSDADQRALSIISYIGCGVSLLGLMLTLLTYMLFKKLRKDNPSKILINLCIALTGSCLVFVIGQQQYSFASPIGCKVVGVLLHYFLLAALTWMAVQAFYMYLALVLVFNTYFSHFMLKCASVGWGVPLIVVAITLGVNTTDNYGLIGKNFCWLHTIPFYAAFVAPVLLILILNFVAFGLVLRNLLGFSARKLTKSHDRTSIVTQLRGAIGIVILLGLAWIFAIFAIGGASVVFHYLFAIFNSLQGLFIFIFYCLLKKDARAQLRCLLSCSCTKTIQYRISHSGFSTRLRRFTSQGTTSTSSGEDHDNKSADARV